jgi:hypothetical protein
MAVLTAACLPACLPSAPEMTQQRCQPTSPPPLCCLQLLLSRIGDTLMLYLLLHTSLFAALPNSCCLQLRCDLLLVLLLLCWCAGRLCLYSVSACCTATVPSAAAGCCPCLICSGAPISQVARAWRKEAPPAVAAAATRLLAGAGPAALEGAAAAGADGGDVEAAGRAAAGEGDDDVLLTQLPSAGGSADDIQWQFGSGQEETAPVPALTDAAGAEAAGVPPSATAEHGQQGKAAARPSSWQRRRAAKLRQQQEAVAAAGAMQVDGSDLLNEWGLPATQPLDSQGQPVPAGAPAAAAANAVAGADPALPNGPAAAAAAPAAAGGGTAGGAARGGAAARQRRSSWPARMPRPTDMLLQRTSIFYCASFPQKPGLTTQRELLLACYPACNCPDCSTC